MILPRSSRVGNAIPRLIVPIFLVAVTLYFGRTLGMAIYYQYFQIPGEVKVPRVVGKDVQVAQGILQHLGLGIDVTETRFEDKIPQQEVMQQDPPADSDVRVGRKVGVVVSLGPEQVAVPRILGMSLRDAQVALADAHLEAGTIKRVQKRKGEPEEVIEQNPRSGKLVKKGTKISIVLNMGNEALVKVPRFEGQNIAAARDKIGQLGLKVGSLDWIINGEYTPGTVVRQDPVPNRSVAPGTAVDMKICAASDWRAQEVHQRTITVVTPDEAGPQDMRVQVDDGNGSFTAYRGTHYSGEQFTVQVTGINGGEYEVYANDRLLYRKRI